MIASSQNMMQLLDLYLKPRYADGWLPGCMHGVSLCLTPDQWLFAHPQRTT
jgi:hypothetical protein